MLEHLPQEMIDGLARAERAAGRPHRMQVEVGGQSFTILRYWKTGFSVDAASAMPLRGNVDLYEGGRHMGRCLVVAGDRNSDEAIYEFKRNTLVCDGPPRDFAVDESFFPALPPR